MKRINALAWLITMLMTLVASTAVAADWGSEKVTMQVGETKTLYLPSSITSKTLKSVSFYSASYNYVKVVSHSNYSVKVTALKATSTPVVVRCDYYYYINNGGYTYLNGGAYDFNVVVGGETTVKPTKITIPSTVSVEVGESLDIETTVTPSNAEYTLPWSISDNSIATVYQNGMITGKSVGYADLKVKADNGVYAMCRVSVYRPTPTNVNMKSSLAMNVGDTYTLSPIVYPTNSKYTLTWTSSDTNVATVSSSGEVTAKSAGTANITVTTDNGKTASCKVEVSTKSVTDISIPSTLSLEVGETYTLTPSITPSDVETSFIWSSDNSGVADVSQSGVVSAKSAGTANITVTTDNGKTANCTVTVNASPVVEYEVNFSIYGYEFGEVLHNGSKLVGETVSGYGSFKVAEGSDIALTILPNEGYKINWVWVDYKDVADQLVNNVLTIRDIRENTSIVVSFELDETASDEPVVTSENTITLSNVTANIGTTVSFPIGLDNVNNITAFQMDLYLPTEITLATDEDGNVKIETTERVSNNHTVDCSKMDDGSYHIICYSTENNNFTGYSGELFSLPLVVGAELQDGDYDITASNIELSDKTGTTYIGQDVKCMISVKSFISGDVDGNGQHSINDVVCIVNYVLNRPNTTFIESAADLDENGKITVNDAVLFISNYILGTSSNASKATRAASGNNEENYLYIEDVKLHPGEVKTIEVMMLNECDDIRGIQCDITLPDGISFLFDEDSENYVTASYRIPMKMALSSEVQDEHTLRIAGVCTGYSSIYGNTGSVFTFKVKADDDIKDGIYGINMSNMELSNGEAIRVVDRSSALEILNETSGIISISSNEVSGSMVYNLNGQCVNKSMVKSGIFIINGKKVLIK